MRISCFLELGANGNKVFLCFSVLELPWLSLCDLPSTEDP